MAYFKLKSTFESHKKGIKKQLKFLIKKGQKSNKNVDKKLIDLILNSWVNMGCIEFLQCRKTP